MSKVANIVLYTLTAAGVTGFNRHAVASPSADDPLRAVTISHAAMEAISDAKKRGVDVPLLQCLLEEREANEQGVLFKSNYTELDLITLAPKGPAKQERAAHDPQTKAQTDEQVTAAKARAAIEAKISAQVGEMVQNALAAQAEAIAKALASGATVAAVMDKVRTDAAAAVAVAAPAPVAA